MSHITTNSSLKRFVITDIKTRLSEEMQLVYVSDVCIKDTSDNSDTWVTFGAFMLSFEFLYKDLEPITLAGEYDYEELYRMSRNCIKLEMEKATTSGVDINVHLFSLYGSLFKRSIKFGGLL